MRNAVIADGTYGGITTDYFSKTVCCRISIVGGCHISGQHTAHSRQIADEFSSDQCRFFTLKFSAAGTFSVSGEAKTCKYLTGQQVEQAFDVYADVVFDGAAVDCGITKITGEEDGTR